MNYNYTCEENDIIFISLTNKVKQIMQEQSDSNIEGFIEKEFPQDVKLDLYFFKHIGKNNDNLIGIKTDHSPYALFVKRSDQGGEIR